MTLLALSWLAFTNRGHGSRREIDTANASAVAPIDAAVNVPASGGIASTATEGDGVSSATVTSNTGTTKRTTATSSARSKSTTTRKSSTTQNNNPHAGQRYLGVFSVTCYALQGKTSTGKNASVDYVAVDPQVIPYGTHLYIDGVGYRTAEDTGTAITGNSIDIWRESRDECLAWGRQPRAVWAA